MEAFLEGFAWNRRNETDSRLIVDRVFDSQKRSSSLPPISRSPDIFKQSGDGRESLIKAVDDKWRYFQGKSSAK